MADANVSVSINATKSTAAIGETAKELKNLGDVTGDVAKALAGLISAAAIEEFFRQSIKEALENEEAYRVLQSAIEATGASWRSVEGDVKRFAESQQVLTRFAETDTVQAMSKLAQVAGDASQAIRATALAEDIAAGTGRSLGDATQIVSNLLAGQQRGVTLARREFAAYVGDAHDATTVLARLAEHFDGAAAKEQSYSKGLAQSRAALKTFGEDVGSELLPIVGKLASGLSVVAKTAEEVGTVLVGMGAKAVVSLDSLWERMKATLTLNAKAIEDINKRTAQTIDAIDKQTGDSLVATEKRYTSAVEDQGTKRKALRAKEADEAKKIQAELGKKFLELLGDQYSAQIADLNEQIRLADEAGVKKFTIVQNGAKREVTTEELKNAQMKKLNLQHAKDSADVLNQIASLSNAKTAEIAAIGKAAAVARAIVEAYVAANEALAAFGFLGPGALAVSGAILGVGLANAAIIAGVPLAQGGVAKARPGGITAQIAEGGQDEAVIPLGNPEATRRIRDAIGGSQASGAVINNYFSLPHIDALRDPRVVEEVLDMLADAMARRTPNAIVFARRAADLEQLNSRRAA